MDPTLVMPATPAPPPLRQVARPRTREGLPADEEVLIRRRHRHWVVLMQMISVPVIVTLVTAALLLLLGGGLLPGGADVGFGSTLLATLLLVALLACVVWTVYAFWDWWADWITLTARRVIVRESQPLRNETRREIPLNKIQNVVSSYPGPIRNSLKFGRLDIDTAGLGTISFDDIPDPADLRVRILNAQKAVMDTLQPIREQYRQQMVQSILYGTKPPTELARLIEPSPRSGYGLFNQLLPIRPQRDGFNVIWHTHWWFLLRAARLAFVLVIGYEGTMLAVRLANFSQSLAALASLRVPIWFIAVLILIYQYMDWHNDYYEVRGDTLIDYEARPFKLFEQVKETKLNRITDIRVNMTSVLSMLLNFGNIVIRTPGEATPFTFDGVPNPRAVLSEIMDLVEAERAREQAQWARDVQEWLRAYTDEIHRWQAWQAQGAGPQSPPAP